MYRIASESKKRRCAIKGAMRISMTVPEKSTPAAKEGKQGLLLLVKCLGPIHQWGLDILLNSPE
jgi:hypothetical protein